MIILLSESDRDRESELLFVLSKREGDFFIAAQCEH